MEIIAILSAKYLYLVVIFLSFIFFLTLRKEDKIKMIWLALIAGLISLVMVVLGGVLISDPRPFVVEGIKPLISHAADNGFPSDHTLVTMLAAVLVTIFKRIYGIILIILAILVGVSRVLVRVHHPLDIIGSIIIAVTSILIAVVVYRKVIATQVNKGRFSNTTNN